ncbi:hypothetical protein GCM10010909_33270 [Acidocella aquatica]|uniref:Radical SAM core domain-containing protein n=1 Tax=Acidocella aquatica TaxID=1922313 RepID=A0ABQ6AF28_9PROT|nr:radical SAM protein [Acidocella aquatica]GLR68645.1 hypothetical protein GCM10010909_33270 [Acidocella aquatica]
MTLHNSFGRDPSGAGPFLLARKFGHKLKSFYRAMRITRPMTWILGPQYRAAMDLIEIDLTYLCNLKCNNCNRSSAQAPEARHLSLDQLKEFVTKSLHQGRGWRRIRLLGGEPTLHPHFHEAIAVLEPLRARTPGLLIEVVTNGYGDKVKQALRKLPPHVAVENSQKSGPMQPHFGAFNKAPQDSWWHRLVDYRNGCEIVRSCGMGLTPTGYYHCAVAGGIDRVTGEGLGRTSLPAADDEMRDLMDRTCRLCGRFRDGHFIPFNFRKPLLVQQTSRSWKRIYGAWLNRQSAAGGERL